MKPELNVAVALVISLLCIQHSFSDELSDTALKKWKCKCSSFQGNHIYSLSNCSKSCDCHSDSEESASIWTCKCDPNGFPKVTADGHNLNCFNACRCTWGTDRIPLVSKKLSSSKIVVVILSMCLVSTTIAFLTSVVCHVCQRRSFPIQSSMISSDKETSYNSTSNLIIHSTSSVPETKVVIHSPISHIRGCFQKAYLLFGSQRETFQGNIIQFSFAELENATENFSASNLIGFGGSSYVYRGRLKDGSNVAVKRLKDQRGPEADSEFFTEATPRLQDSRRVIMELVDPQLKGNFPQEEVHIMAYLAKECLLLDPDTRPTMSEVVQIISSISPGKSRRRRSIPVSLFQELEDAEKQRQAQSSRFLSHNLLPLSNDYNIHFVNENKDEHTASTEHMESSILLSSKGESWHASEEEMVDLTEPRFESFF